MILIELLLYWIVFDFLCLKKLFRVKTFLGFLKNIKFNHLQGNILDSQVIIMQTLIVCCRVILLNYTDFIHSCVMY